MMKAIHHGQRDDDDVKVRITKMRMGREDHALLVMSTADRMQAGAHYVCFICSDLSEWATSDVGKPDSHVAIEARMTGSILL